MDSTTKLDYVTCSENGINPNFPRHILKEARIMAVMNAIAFITAMIIAFLISNPQFNI